MKKTRTMVRWVCPRCQHGRVAPSRPRKDDARRYCLVCTEKIGRLVCRVAPSLEKRREERKLTLDERRKQRALRILRRESAKYMVAGINILDEVASMLKVSTFEHIKHLSIALRVRRCAKKPNRLGTAWYASKRIQICDYPGITHHNVREILLHEIAHIAKPGDGHGVAWRTCYSLACEQYLGVRPIVKTRFVGEVARLLQERDTAAAAGASS